MPIMKVLFSEFAKQELDDAVKRGEVRKCLLHRFPYKLLYSVESDHIFIIAVAHQHRQPDYWIDEKPS